MLQCGEERIRLTVTKKATSRAWIHWNFPICTLNVVYEEREDLIKRFYYIENSGVFDNNAACDAAGLKRLLEQDKPGIHFFSCSPPPTPRELISNGEILSDQLQKQDWDSAYAANIISQFTCCMNEVQAAL